MAERMTILFKIAASTTITIIKSFRHQDVVQVSLFKLPQAEQYVGTILPQEEHS
jgi:hypothetical protein